MAKAPNLTTHLYRAKLAATKLAEAQRPSRRQIAKDLADISDALALVLSQQRHPFTKSLVTQIKQIEPNEFKDRIFQPDPAWNHLAEQSSVRPIVLLAFAALWSDSGRRAVALVINRLQGKHFEKWTDARLVEAAQSSGGLKYIQKPGPLQQLIVAIGRTISETPEGMRARVDPVRKQHRRPAGNGHGVADRPIAGTVPASAVVTPIVPVSPPPPSAAFVDQALVSLPKYQSLPRLRKKVPTSTPMPAATPVKPPPPVVAKVEPSMPKAQVPTLPVASDAWLYDSLRFEEKKVAWGSSGECPMSPTGIKMLKRLALARGGVVNPTQFAHAGVKNAKAINNKQLKKLQGTRFPFRIVAVSKPLGSYQMLPTPTRS